MGTRSKGNADCHIPNDRYREGWDRIFGREEDPGSFGETVRSGELEKADEESEIALGETRGEV